MKRLLIILFILLLVNKVNSQVPPLTIDLKTEKIQYIYSSELALEGVVRITNNTDKGIVLPKSFDLELIITDTNGNVLKKNPEVMFEYKNLITLKRQQIIKPKHSFSTGFSEWRLFAFPLAIDNKYSVQYSLTTSFYPDLMNELGEKTISSNKVLITIPSH